MIEIYKIFLIVIVVQYLLNTKHGLIVGRFLPGPFWIYFIPMLLNSIGLLNPSAKFINGSFVYDFIAKHILPLALTMMMIATPVLLLLKMGGKALLSMGLGTLTVFVGVVGSFIILSRYFPEGGYKSAASLLATWTGGSANMLAVKEILMLSDQDLAPLIITDTLLSYTWMAILLASVNFQHYFAPPPLDPAVQITDDVPKGPSSNNSDRPRSLFSSLGKIFFLFGSCIIISEGIIYMGALAELYIGKLNNRAWTLLLISIIVVALATTPLKKLESYGASRWGTFLLYVVLAGIGAKTSLSEIHKAPVFILFGILVFVIHGSLMIAACHFFRLPLYLAATASQANIGGPVSAPIVAALYFPRASQFGVFMGILGNIYGTYVGLAGAWVCSHLKL